MKRILINSSYNDELRVAFVEGAKLFDLDTELVEKTFYKGSVFKARVSRVEMSLNAAFVDFGFDKHGFLPLRDLSSEFFTTDNNGKKKCNLKEGQEILVQVNKEERGTKGATLSTQISIAGRFMVLIANSNRGGGISRRITGDEREDLKNQIAKLDIPENMSVIIRTAGIDRTFEELQNDLNYLISLWDNIHLNQVSADAPQCIYTDDKLIVRVFRDIFRDDIEEVLVDNQEVFKEAYSIAELIIPDQKEKVRFYDEEIPLFNRYQIENQIELAFQREISLPSGGSIIIDPTEAMTTIDINSARSTKGKDIEDTAVKTNLEAANEIARQLRLRDVGGLIVIDFIDMLEEDNQQKIEKAFRKAISGDRARTQVANISRFGLLEVSRQRLKPSLNETYDIEHVLVRGPRSLGQSILRIINEDALKENTAEIHVFVPADVASFLNNEKRIDLIRIEESAKIKILIITDPYKNRPYYKVSRVKNTDVNKKLSYQLTPESPSPDMSWRQSKSPSSKVKPLVNALDHKKKNISGGVTILSWIKNLTSSKSTVQKKTSSKKKKNTYKKSVSNKKPFKKKNPSNFKKGKTSINKSNNKKTSSSGVSRKKTGHKKPQNKKNVKSSKPVEVKTSSKETKKKVIKKPPTRALNDPRDN